MISFSISVFLSLAPVVLYDNPFPSEMQGPSLVLINFCSGFENNLPECSISELGFGCGRDQVAGVICPNGMPLPAEIVIDLPLSLPLYTPL